VKPIDHLTVPVRATAPAVLRAPAAPPAPLAETVFQGLLAAIYEGLLTPGSIINEVAIAEEYGVSRGPVREAVRRLQGIQLVTRDAYVKARVLTLSAETAIELFEMRMALEGFACKLAAERMSDAAIGAVFDGLEQDRLRARSGTAPRIFDFHECIMQGSGNRRIVAALCGDLYHLLRIYRRHSGKVKERKHNAYGEHVQILRAIKMRDGERAEALMRAHIGRAADHLFSQLASNHPIKSTQP